MPAANFQSVLGGGGKSGTGSSSFIGLSDVPGSFTGAALKAVTVNAGETALVFTTLAGGGDALVANPLSQFAATTSLQLKGVITDETGSGALVFGTAPTIAGGTHTALIGLGIRSTGAAFDLTLASAEVFTAGRTLTFSLGDAARTLTLSGNPSLSGFTASGTGTLATTTGKTLTFSNTLTLAGTDGTTMTFPTTTATLARTDAANTFTGVQTMTSPSITSAALVTPDIGVATGTSLTLTGGAVTPNIPQNSQSTAYTTVLADANKHLYHPSADTTARTFTIDSNANVAYIIGTTLTFVNDTSGGVITIAITSDTLVLAGAGTTGSRTLAASGIATALKMTSTRWIINGTGLT